MFDALLIVSFGGPEGPDDVVPFLENVTRGRNIPPERLQEVAHHYLRFGGVSPINAQCRELIERLTVEFTAHDLSLPIYWGNRNWHPLLTDVINQMRDDGIRHALAFITSPYSSYSSCRQYLDEIARARGIVGPGAPEVQRLRHYFDHPGFIEPVSRNVRAALAAASDDSDAGETALLFTAHSIPLTMAQASDYEAQLREVARLVTERSAPGHQWSLVWQSRSGPPTMPWLEPDIGDALTELAAAGTRSVVVAPVGFISDHMEVVFDLDVQAAERAAALGLRLVRAATVGAAPEFVAMIRELVEERLDPAVTRRSLGRLGVRHECAALCCPPR
ncbi:MAG TPA: ferrochelatase [Acidimicrobiales bacterium]|nr:ferrochelatase [Acidimicrobiales bacterium]